MKFIFQGGLDMKIFILGMATGLGIGIIKDIIKHLMKKNQQE